MFDPATSLAPSERSKGTRLEGNSYSQSSTLNAHLFLVGSDRR